MWKKLKNFLWSAYIEDVILLDRRTECEQAGVTGPLYRIQYSVFRTICGFTFQKDVILEETSSHTEAVKLFGQIRKSLDVLNGHPLKVGVRV